MEKTPGAIAPSDGVQETLSRLQQHGAGLLPDPDTLLRTKAAALAAVEWQTQADAFKSAGCVPVYTDQDQS